MTIDPGFERKRGLIGSGDRQIDISIQGAIHGRGPLGEIAGIVLMVLTRQTEGLSLVGLIQRHAGMSVGL